MQVGVVFLPTDQSARVDELAVAVEERGLDMLLVGDHTHIPASRKTQWIGGEGPLPEKYRRAHDPWVVLGAAAAVTSRIKLGTCVYLAALRHPIITAKHVASLDVMSNGRVIFGVGVGWNVEETEDHGVEWKSRRRRVGEYIEVMRTLWTEEEASFDGEFVRFEPMWMWPKPVQPRLPVLFGGGPGPQNFAGMVKWSDGWIPMPRLGHTPDHVRELWRLAEDAGRDPSELEIRVNGFTVERDTPPPSVPMTLENLEPWIEIGALSATSPLPAAPLGDLLPLLDGIAEIAEKVRS